MLRKLLSAVAVIALVAADTAPSCKKWDATVEKSISPGLAGLYKTLSPLAVMSPGFGSCLLENQPGIAQLMESLNTTRECIVLGKWLMDKPLSDMPFQNSVRTQAQAMALAGYLQQLNDTNLQSSCTNIIPSAASCMMKQIIPAMLQLNSPCCLDWLNSFTDPTLEFFTSNLIKHVSNILCSTQVINGATQSCGSMFVKAVIPPSNDMVDLFTRLSDFIVVPNEQGCEAQEGLPFNDTSNRAHPPLFKNTTPFSGCSTPLDGFVYWVRTMPYLRLITAFDPSRLFANGTDACIKGGKLLPYLDLFMPKDKVEAVNTITDLYDKKCAHLANSYASTCPFKIPSIPYPLAAQWPYATGPTAASTTKSPSGTTAPQVTSFSPPAMVSMSVLISVSLHVALS